MLSLKCPPRHWLFAAGAAILAALAPANGTASDIPRGIYSLGAARDNPSTPADERLGGIRDYDFVSGFTLRVFWSDLETTQGQYNFTVIDQAIASVSALGQGLNLEILNGEEPQYVLTGASATYVDHRGGTNPVPWDTFAQERLAALRTALANHLVPGAGGMHPLNQDPTLRSIDTAPAGLNFGVRDINSGIRSHADYTQARYVDAVVAGVADSAAAFPEDTNFLAFFAFTDGQPGVRVDEQIINRLAPLYNAPGQAKLDFFVENLSDDGPVPLPSGGGTGNNLLAWVDAGGETMIQALDSWLQHAPDREPQLDSHNPATGIELAFQNYGTRFFELYVADLDGAANGAVDAAGRPLLDDLAAWNHALTAPLTVPGDYNADGIVDAADYTTWRDHVGAATLPNRSPAAQGVVGPADYDVWKSSFATSLDPLAAASIPEPGSLALVSFAAASGGLFRSVARRGNLGLFRIID